MLKKSRPRRLVTALALSSILVIQLLHLVPKFSQTAHAAGSVSLTSLGTTYTENFNTLINGANDTLSSSGIPNGWDFSESGTGANTTYRTGTGSGTAGDTYSFGTPTTSLTTGTYIDVNALDFIPPVTSGTVGALDGNAAAPGADDGLAVDDFSLTPLAQLARTA